MKTFKKIFAFILAAILIATIIPHFALADDEYLPNVQIVVSKYNDVVHYGFNSTNTVKDYKSQNKALTGDKITLSFILSGIDTVDALELRGSWNSDYLAPGYYTNGRNGSVWVKQTLEDSISNKCIIENTNKTLNDTKWTDGHSLLDCNSDSEYENLIYLATYFNGGKTLPTTTNYKQYNSETEETSDYTVDGAVMYTVGFEALQDIDNIYDVFTWDSNTVTDSNGTSYAVNIQSIACNHSHNTNKLTDCTEGLYCSVCGEEVIAPTEHTYDNWECNNDGTHSSTCSVCGHKITEDCNYEETVIDATCTTSGYTLHKCSECGDYYVDNYVNALGHDYSNCEGYVAPTCTKDGYTGVGTCARCEEEIKGSVIPALGHDYSNCKGYVAPTCTKDGYTGVGTCARCGEEIKGSVIPALGHDYSNCEGYVAPTCTEDGCTGTGICARCGAKFNNEVIPATGHKYDKYTSNNDGTHNKICSKCNDVITEDCNYTSVVTDPTCTEKGYTTYTCTDCGYSFKSDYTDMIDHEYGKWVSNNDGTHSKTCSKCNDVVTEKCSYKATKVVEPTYNHQGYTVYTCQDCGYSYNGNFVDFPSDVKDLIDKVNNLPDPNKTPVKDYLDDLKDIEDTSKKISDENKNKIPDNIKKTVDDISQVIPVIEDDQNLPDPAKDPNEYIKAVKDLVDEYNDLTDDQKGLVPDAVKKDIDSNEKIANVIDETNKLPDPAKDPDDFVNKVKDLTDDYNNLTDDEKDKVPDGIKDKIKDAQDIADIIKGYNKLPDPNKDPNGYNDALKDLYDDYNKLSKDQQQKLPEKIILLMEKANEIFNSGKNGSTVKTGSEYRDVVVMTLIASFTLGAYLVITKKKKINE